MADPIKVVPQGNEDALGPEDYQTILDLIKAHDPRGMKLAQTLKPDEVQTFFDFQKQANKGINPAASPDRNLATGIPFIGSLDPADVAPLGSMIKAGGRVLGGSLSGMANGLENGFSRGMAGGLKGLLNELGFGSGAASGGAEAASGVANKLHSDATGQLGFDLSDAGSTPMRPLATETLGHRPIGGQVSLRQKLGLGYKAPNEAASQMGLDFGPPAEKAASPINNVTREGGPYNTNGGGVKVSGQGVEKTGQTSVKIRKPAAANDTGFRGGMSPGEQEGISNLEKHFEETGNNVHGANSGGHGTFKEGGNGNLGGPDTAGLRTQGNVSLRRTPADLKENVQRGLGGEEPSNLLNYNDKTGNTSLAQDVDPYANDEVERIQAEIKAKLDAAETTRKSKLRKPK